MVSNTRLAHSLADASPPRQRFAHLIVNRGILALEILFEQ